MKALVIVEPGKTEVRDVPEPVPGDGDVLLRVGRVGFCGGDLKAFQGTFALQQYPCVLGHEIGAVVLACGRTVPPDRVRPGQRVTLSPYLACGACLPCRSGRPNACVDNRTMGVRRPGAMTERIAAPWQDLFHSERLSLRELALAEPLTVGFHAVERGRVTQDDTVAVLGCGIVGLGAVAGAAARGATVIAVDIDDRKLAIARKAGAAHAVNSAKAPLHAALQELTRCEGPRVVIEAVGHPATFRAAVDEAAFTGRVVYIGYAKTPVEYETRMFVQKELDVLGSRNCLGDFPRVIAALEAGRFPVEDVVSREVTLADAGAALAGWARDPGAVTKILVNMES
jgi:threonine dehydrogenase-like Zn-dependent dehydrogenase